MKPLLSTSTPSGLQYGADPELFFRHQGKIVGSERVIPPEGLQAEEKDGKTTSPDGIHSANYYWPSTKASIVRDGVQAELHPAPMACRQRPCVAIANGFRRLDRHLKENKIPVEIDFSTVIELDEEEFQALSPESRQLGCMPSLNAYDDHSSLGVDPATYRIRSAGGHIHLGINDNKSNLSQLVPLLDLIVGNTSVLIDRDPLAAKRREVYGRAGEYRLPKHGLEYRTLSNWWLRSYQTASLVFGLAKIAYMIWSRSQGSWKEYSGVDFYGKATSFDYAKDLFSRVDQQAVRTAINANDFNLAWKNWEGLKSFLKEFIPHADPSASYGTPGLAGDTINDFEFFVEKGLDYWFPLEQTLPQWLILYEGHGCGWEVWLNSVVRSARTKKPHPQLLAGWKPSHIFTIPFADKKEPQHEQHPG